jgi:anti-sigma factor RsiW
MHLDAGVHGGERMKLTEHLRACPACSAHFNALLKTQSLVSSLGRKSAPPELALKLKVAISKQRSVSWGFRLQSFAVRFENAVNAFMLPATAGFATAIVMFGLLIGVFAAPVAAGNDVPTTLYTPPRLAAAPFSNAMGRINADSPVVIEALVDSKGRVTDYRIISGDDSEEVRRQLERSLIFTVFEPATSFGEPADGRAVISFANVNVKG